MRRLAGSLLGVLLAAPVFAATRTASIDGLWSSTATWGGAPVPGNTDDCTINANVDVIVDAPSVCGSLTIAANGNVRMLPGTSGIGLTIGDGLAAGTSDNTTVSGGLWIGPGQYFHVSTTNTTGAARGTITISGTLSAAGNELMHDGLVSTVGAEMGNWPARTVTLAASGISQFAPNALAGKVLVPSSGWFRQAWFDITANTPATVTVRIDGSAASGTHRGQVDSRNRAGRRDPGVTAGTTSWAPGDWGETIDGGMNAAPATATVASGGTTVTVSGAWPGGTGRMAAFLGSRFICAADISADNDPDVRIIESITDSTHFVLKEAYGTASCAAGGDYRIWVDNQPPVAAAISETFTPGDLFDIIDPAIVGVPPAFYSDTTQTAQIGAIKLSDGGTFVGRNLEIGNCGNYLSGAAAQGCFIATTIDNSNEDEGLDLDRVEFHHYNGIAAIDLEDCAHITMNRLSIRDAAEGGNAATVAAGTCPRDEAHGIRINDNASGTPRVAKIAITNSRVVRTNDVGLSPYDALEPDGINCTDCSLRNAFMGFSPNSCGGSTQCIGLARGVSNFQGSDIFCTNAPASYACTGASGTTVCEGSISDSVFQNSLEGFFKVGTLTDATGILDANARFYLVSNLFRNIGGGDASGLAQRGRWYSNWIEPANQGANQILQEPQEAKGNVIIVPPNFDNGGSVLNHEPTGTARIEPATLREWDNAFLGPTAFAAGTGTLFLGGKHGAGNDSLASDASFLHNTFVGNGDSLTVGWGQVAWRFRDDGTGMHVVKDNIFFDMAASYSRVNGRESVSGDDNLCLEVPVNQCPIALPAGANTLTTGTLGIVDAASGNFNLLPGSTAMTSLGSDGMPRGVRVAGPPSWERLMKLVPGLRAKPVIVNITAAQGGIDTDLDGVWDLHDNCPRDDNPGQEDTDGDGVGDACERRQRGPVDPWPRR
jgi:hypothetical protein